jgi:DNA-binding NarL/FixJ family response regulator
MARTTTSIDPARDDDAIDVLLIEDDDIDAEVVRRHLREIPDVAMRRSRTLDEVRREMSIDTPDLVIADLFIPGATSPGEIIAEAAVAPVVVAYSGVSDLETVLNGMRDRVEHLIPKGSPSCGELLAFYAGAARRKRDRRESIEWFADRVERALSFLDTERGAA